MMCYFTLADEVVENYGDELRFKDFMRHSFEPRPFMPVWKSSQSTGT